MICEKAIVKILVRSYSIGSTSNTCLVLVEGDSVEVY